VTCAISVNFLFLWRWCVKLDTFLHLRSTRSNKTEVLLIKISVEVVDSFTRWAGATYMHLSFSHELRRSLKVPNVATKQRPGQGFVFQNVLWTENQRQGAFRVLRDTFSPSKPARCHDIAIPLKSLMYQTEEFISSESTVLSLLFRIRCPSSRECRILN